MHARITLRGARNERVAELSASRVFMAGKSDVVNGICTRLASQKNPKNRLYCFIDNDRGSIVLFLLLMLIGAYRKRRAIEILKDFTR